MSMTITPGALLLLAVLMTASCGAEAVGTANVAANVAADATPPPVNSNPVSTNKNIMGGPQNAFQKNLPGGFNDPEDDVARKLLKEYGAVFLARGGAIPPKTVVFKDEGEVSAYQSGVAIAKERIGGYEIELQTPAMKALKEAIAEAGSSGKSITPRGADSARRSYAATVGLWASRVDPALAHWVAGGKLDKATAEHIRRLTPYQQVPEVFKLENKGMYFSKDLSKSIIYSVAPPGTSQHLSMLALDVAEFQDAKVREILARHGWYQTVVSDLPHFTFLGVSEKELPALGLKRVTSGGRAFWVPEI